MNICIGNKPPNPWKNPENHPSIEKRRINLKERMHGNNYNKLRKITSRSEKCKQKISISNSGKNNGMYGKKNGRNFYDAMKKIQGENTSNAKLTNEQAAELKSYKNLYFSLPEKGGYRTKYMKKLMKKYSLGRAAIRNILIENTWKNIQSNNQRSTWDI